MRRPVLGLLLALTLGCGFCAIARAQEEAKTPPHQQWSFEGVFGTYDLAFRHPERVRALIGLENPVAPHNPAIEARHRKFSPRADPRERDIVRERGGTAQQLTTFEALLRPRSVMRHFELAMRDHEHRSVVRRHVDALFTRLEMIGESPW